MVPSALGGSVGFTTRRGGVSQPPYDSLNLGGAVGDDPAAVAANRARVAAAAGLAAGRVVWMRQVHGATVTRGDAAGRVRSEPLPDSDGIVTAGPRCRSGGAGRGLRADPGRPIRWPG